VTEEENLICKRINSLIVEPNLIIYDVDHIMLITFLSNGVVFKRGSTTGVSEECATCKRAMKMDASYRC